MAHVGVYHHGGKSVPDVIVELDGARPPQRRRADRFIVGALLSGSLVFGIGVAVARPQTPLRDAAPTTTEAPAVAPTPILPVPSTTPRFRIQPPIFIPPSGLPGRTVAPLPPPGVFEPRG